MNTMKPILTAFVLAVSLAASPVLAFSIDAGSLTPTLTYPDPAPQPVTKDQGGISK
ncbi:hypothetical protein ROTO_20670 [Roseovarius tolerans]|uniref:Uncharacterized protein n=1 Tax=Roseovarius tolerans TaxID=74031 RepID=A0A0L6CV58_9RHOB|nr:hypothetical protein [Roseovarius tolerans]KNX41378.1 hypothetical protein ROTO_20670 [Roseovarius tolerans]